jgi:transposase
VSLSAKREGFPDEYWSPSRVRRYIKREFDVNYSIQHIKPLLKKHGIAIKSERDRNVLPKTLFMIKRKKPKDFGLPYEDWTLELIIKYMRATFGKQYSPEYVRRFLKSHGIEFRKER